MGRPPELTLHQKREAIQRRDKGEESLTDIGRCYNVSAPTDCVAVSRASYSGKVGNQSRNQGLLVLAQCPSRLHTNYLRI
jgi:hypothetical protein